jgi:beta-mannosidase
VHHPKWKARVPRDHGAGWDFEDVRDHYLEALFGVHPMRLRYADMDRYLALSRVVTGEVMARTIGEWRRAGSTCGGALIWFLQDLWPGAGWGLIDATGRPKAAYYAVKRAMQPRAVTITDEGANGLHIHVTNDREQDLEAVVRVALFRNGAACIASGSAAVTVPGRGASFVVADALLERFYDVAYAYRFGPPGHDLVVATLHDASGARIADAFHFPLGIPSARRDDVGLTVDAERHADGSVAVVVRAERFAQSVAIDAGDAVPDENYFHLAPGDARVVVFPASAGKPLSEVFVQPLNAHRGVRATVPGPKSARACAHRSISGRADDSSAGITAPRPRLANAAWSSAVHSATRSCASTARFVTGPMRSPMLGSRHSDSITAAPATPPARMSIPGEWRRGSRASGKPRRSSGRGAA